MKTKNSKELFKKSKEHIAGGVNSPVRAFKSVGGTPIFFRKSRDCYLYDEDGNKYIDFVGSWGPMVLGHSNKQIIDAIKKALNCADRFAFIGLYHKESRDTMFEWFNQFPTHTWYDIFSGMTQYIKDEKQYG